MAMYHNCILLVACLHATFRCTSGVVTVHLVPHTHDDTGWLKTVDQYFTGQNNSIQHANVNMILNSVVRSLFANPERTFTYVEMAFFKRWWQQQSPLMKNMVRGLVEKGQLSFANGGWCMHDEAAPFYLDMVDQTTLGHKFLMDELGVAPKVGWQIDPFGHSATQAALLSAEVGFTGLFFGRIDYQDIATRLNHSAAEFIWRASPSLGNGPQVFCGITGSYAGKGGSYGPPPGFNFDIAGTDAPVQDDPRLKDYNVKSRVEDFVAAALKQAKVTRGSHVMFTMGEDFTYEAAEENYANIDKIIKYVNQDGRVQARYSTPEIYMAEKAQESAVSWPLKTDDFFPYADGPHMFWTGYFTSRPALKRYIRDSSSFFQVVKQMDALAGTAGILDGGLDKLADAMGIGQHHDAVAGTAKQHVTFDYAARLAEGREAALPLAGKALAKLAGSDGGADVVVCDLRNVSVCAPTQRVTGPGQRTDFVLWNGLSQARSEIVELPVGSCNVAILGADGEEVESQLVPSLASITNYGEPAPGSDMTLLFLAEVPPLGFKRFSLINRAGRSCTTSEDHDLSAPLHVGNELVELSFCGGVLCKLTDEPTKVTVRVNQAWGWYESNQGAFGADSASPQPSGAYVFRPLTQDITTVSPTSLRVVRGSIATEVYQTFGDWISQRIRLSKGSRHLEITYTVGPIPVEGGGGKEVVTRFSTDIQSAGECYTDSNGREMMWRKRDFRPSWQFNQTEPVAGNYFPISTAISIRDPNAQLTVLTETTQAGGSIHDGEVELMVHRRVLRDDFRGVGEPLDETRDVEPYIDNAPTCSPLHPDACVDTGKPKAGQHSGPGLVVRGRHLLSVGTPASAAEVWRPQVDRFYLPLQPLFPKGSSTWQHATYTALLRPLPPNVQLVSLQQWDQTRVLIRLAHQFGLGEDRTLSSPVTVDLGTLFADWRIAEVEERGLAATVSRAEVLRRRVPWRIEGEATAPLEAEKPPGDLQVTLGPLQIRTFLLGLAPQDSFTTYM